MTDAELLEQHRLGSQSAFAELVRRHINWVHSVARRRIRDEHLAEDVTQAAFMTLARKPPRLWSGSPLSPWLLKVVNLTCKAVLRSDSNRRRRETEAAKMRSEVQSIDVTDANHWNEISPHVDQFVEQLRNSDRSVVMLRFYEQKSFAEVGAAIGISEEAARKRVSRAIEKLRGLMVSRGVTIPANALAGVLLAEACKPAPPALAALIGGSGGTAAAASTVLPWVKGVTFTMAISNAKIGFTAAVLALLAVGGGSLLMLHVTPTTRPSIAAAPTSVPTTSESDPIARFRQKYKLDPTEDLKHMALPLSPEREQYYHTVISPNSKGLVPSHIGFAFDRSLQLRFMSLSKNMTVSHLMTGMLDISPYDFEIPAEIAALDVSGDWIIRPGVPMEKLLAALSPIIYKEHGRRVTFETRPVEQDAIVVHGQYSFHAVPGADPAFVHVYAAELDGDVSGQFNDPLPKFFATVGGQMRMRFVLETEGPQPAQVRWKYHQSALFALSSSPGPQRDQKIRQLLNNLTAQTGLTFANSRRVFDIWYGVESTDK